MNKKTNVTMPQKLYESSPFLRLIVIFRNPVDRFFSAFYYYRWDGVTAAVVRVGAGRRVVQPCSFDNLLCAPARFWGADEPTPGPEDFHERAVKEIGEWQSCVKAKGQAHCLRHYHPQQVQWYPPHQRFCCCCDKSLVAM